MIRAGLLVAALAVSGCCSCPPRVGDTVRVLHPLKHERPILKVMVDRDQDGLITGIVADRGGVYCDMRGGTDCEGHADDEETDDAR